MEIGFIGLGRMGKNMVLRLLKDEHRVVVWNRSPEPVEEVKKKGAIQAEDIEELVIKLESKPKIVWIMLPAGDVTDKMIKKVALILQHGDIIIDGGNSNFRDSIEHYRSLKKKNIEFMDIGVSGGLKGAEVGYCMMVGGNKNIYNKMNPLFKSLCIKNGFAHMGKSGSGHYVKMVHNAIEYGMMQAIAEGFDLLENGHFKDLKLDEIANVWNNGSIITSFLMEMTAAALKKDNKLSYLKPYVDDSGEGRWAAKEAIDQAVPFLVNTFAVQSRFASREKNSYAYRMLAAIRNEFGGHPIKKK